MSTGFKINHASDNAANYSISTNMTTKIGAYEIAEENVSMGLDMLVVTTDILSLMQDKASRLQSLSTQARNGTYGAESIAAMNLEANSIVSDILMMYNNSQYNGIALLNKAFASLPDTAPKAGESGFIDESAVPAELKAGSNGFIDESAVPAELKAGSSGFIDESFAKVDTSSMKTLTAAVSEGQTIKGGTWAIGSVEDLKKLAELTNTTTDNTTGTTFVLSNDIDLSSVDNWTPIGDRATNSSYTFKGTFEGNGHVIKNLKINNPTKSSQGLFGYTYSGSKIQNVGVENASVTGNSYVGGLAGYAFGTITNSYATGDVSGNSNYVGGLAGYAYGATITNSYATGDVSGNNKCVGGLAGYTRGVTITNSYVTGDVSGNGERVGGLAGDFSSGTITNSYATGDVSGNSNNVGGLAGNASDTITNSYATGDVNGNNNYVGGLAGYTNSTITNSYATGDVSGTGTYVGGLAGSAQSTITNSYATGNASGTSFVGGLVGRVYKTSGTMNITNSYSLGKASGSEAVGSFIGGIVNTTDGTTFSTINISNCQTMSSETLIGGAYKYASSTNTKIDYDMTPWLNGIQEIDPTTTLQVGINSASSSQITTDMSFIFNFASLKNGIKKESTLNAILKFSKMLSQKQTELGSVSNRLESVLNEISVNYENLVSSRSTLRDADISEVSSEYIRQQILQQASATLLATANQSPALALQLL